MHTASTCNKNNDIIEWEGLKEADSGRAESALFHIKTGIRSLLSRSGAIIRGEGGMHCTQYPVIWNYWSRPWRGLLKTDARSYCIPWRWSVSLMSINEVLIWETMFQEWVVWSRWAWCSLGEPILILIERLASKLALSIRSLPICSLSFLMEFFLKKFCYKTRNNVGYWRNHLRHLWRNPWRISKMNYLLNRHLKETSADFLTKSTKLFMT